METKPVFAPVLAIPNGTTDISFYTRAFDAVEVMRYSNDDGSIHVSELSINRAIFHLHEVMPNSGRGTALDVPSTVAIGLFVDDVQAVFDQAISAGAKQLLSVTDHDYGYRQGEFEDPFGHRWIIQKVI
jgi:PhnB protein